MSLAVLAVLSGVIIFLTVAGAGAFVWTVALATLALGATYLVVAAHPRREDHEFSYPPRYPWLEGAFLATLLFLLLSAMPLPLSLSQLGGPDRYEQNVRAAEILKKAEQAGVIAEARFGFAISRNRVGTLRIALLAVAAFLAASLSSSLKPRHRLLLLYALSVLGVLIAIAGFIGQWVRPQGDTLWWFIKVPRNLPSPVGGFVNRNHHGGYLAMLAPVALGTAMGCYSRRRWLAGVLYLLACLVMVGGAVFTLSRGAIIACAVGMPVALVMAAIPLRPRHTAAVGALILIAVIGTACLPAEETETAHERLSTLRNPLQTESARYRLNAWRDCLRIWRAYPLIGAGANAFRMVYPQHRTTSASDFMTHPENEYAQLVSETGLAGIALCVLVVIALSRYRIPAHDQDWGIRIATAGAIGVALTHAVFDFAPHAPLYTITLAAILGLCLAPPVPEHAPTLLRGQTPWTGIVAVATTLLLMTLHRDLQNLDYLPYIERATPDAVARTLAQAPTSWQSWYYLGRHACATGKEHDAHLGERCLTQATTYDPNNYRLWLVLGQLRLSQDKTDGARDAFDRAKSLRSWLNVPALPPQRSRKRQAPEPATQ